ncbi:hypothetical protein [Rikenella microfusus]|uniref:hypothetical protein n=1 Tax=Rikenella microfusus TaxID=28139 RepID=UPI003A93857E
MDNPIGAYLDDYSLLDGPGAAARLYDIVQAYPWFTLGRYMQLRSLRDSDPAGYSRVLRRADVRLFVHPWPRLLSDNAPATGAPLPFSCGMSPESYPETGYGAQRPDTVSVIDEFLSNENAGERIAPPPPEAEGAQEDISAESVAEDGEIATETLAGIYLAQGLPDRAIEIYYKLSLKYPEKSVYFANLIADVRARCGIG